MDNLNELGITEMKTINGGSTEDDVDTYLEAINWAYEELKKGMIDALED